MKTGEPIEIAVVLNAVYEILREESTAARIELLELVVILLIGLEILLTIFRH